MLAATAAACWRSGPETEPLRVDRTSPVLGEPDAPVLLNDALTVYFRDSILPLSVTPHSVSLLDEHGLQVPGSLDVGENWLAFRPSPPLGPELDDGSFRPGGRYRLVLAGDPRPGAIRAKDGRWLDEVAVFDVFVADVDERPPGLPSILRPPPSDLPFVQRSSDLPLQVAADAPRLYLHFTQPLLPPSVRSDAFEIRLLKGPIEELVPRSVRVVTSPLDEHPGSSVELDLGALPQRTDGTQLRLREGDLLSVALRGDRGLCDYAGRAPLPSPPSSWYVVAGGSLPLCEWPGGTGAYGDDDGLAPGFEVHEAGVRPRVRVEAGDGRLGVFRPTHDVVLRPGQPFDAGGGRLVVSEGGDFPFLAIDVPAGVRVTVDAQTAPVRLLACGGVRVAGELALSGPALPLPGGRLSTTPVQELTAQARVAIVAAGDVAILGPVTSDAPPDETRSPLFLATAGRLVLRGSLPFQTVLGVEGRGGGDGARIDGPRGQSRAYAVSFRHGPPDGAAFRVSGVLPWRQLPVHVDACRLRVFDAEGDLGIAWQAAPPDALRGDRPDLGSGRVGRWQATRDGEVLPVGPAGFVRLRLEARVVAGQPLPRVRELRLVEP